MSVNIPYMDGINMGSPTFRSFSPRHMVHRQLSRQSCCCYHSGLRHLKTHLEKRTTFSGEMRIPNHGNPWGKPNKNIHYINSLRCMNLPTIFIQLKNDSCMKPLFPASCTKKSLEGINIWVMLLGQVKIYRLYQMLWRFVFSIFFHWCTRNCLYTYVFCIYFFS